MMFWVVLAAFLFAFLSLRHMTFAPPSIVNKLPRYAACLLPLILLQACQQAAQPEEPIRAVRTLRIESSGSSINREFSGEVKARLESQLSFRVPGKLLTRPVNLGDTVKAGQVLAQLDPTDLSLAQQAASAALAAAQAQSAQAQADFQRFEKLKEQGFVSPAMSERYLTAMKSAQAAQAQARANASVQGNQAAYSQLRADGSGVITAIASEPGQVVAAGMPVVTLAHDGPRDVVFFVPDDMGPVVRQLVGQGQAIKVRPWGAGAWSPATVREVAAAADGMTRTLQVKAEVVGKAVNLGQTAAVSLQVPSRIGQGLLLPLEALGEYQGQSFVWVLDAATMTVKRQMVKTAEVSGNLVLIATGLQSGQEVVTAGVHVLEPGQKVKRLQAVE
jgi:membrane fusion protein, multidrug efflux system